MRRFHCATFAAVAFVGFASVASAADLPAKAPVYKAPIAEPAYSWTGFYIGANVGGGWAKTNTTTQEFAVGPGTADLQSFTLNGSGVLGGLHAGYNWQVAPSWLLGIEGDVDWTGIKASTSAPLTISGVAVAGASETLSRDVTWLASIRGRVGYTMANWLFYATGGAAWGGLKVSATQTALGPAIWPYSATTTRSGWVAGAGVEHALTRNWLLRAEYLFYSLNGISASAPSTTALVTPTFTDTFGRTEIHTVRAGISYKFN